MQREFEATVPLRRGFAYGCLAAFALGWLIPLPEVVARGGSWVEVLPGSPFLGLWILAPVLVSLIAALALGVGRRLGLAVAWGLLAAVLLSGRTLDDLSASHLQVGPVVRWGHDPIAPDPIGWLLLSVLLAGMLASARRGGRIICAAASLSLVLLLLWPVRGLSGPFVENVLNIRADFRLAGLSVMLLFAGCGGLAAAMLGLRVGSGLALATILACYAGVTSWAALEGSRELGPAAALLWLRAMLVTVGHIGSLVVVAASILRSNAQDEDGMRQAPPRRYGFVVAGLGLLLALLAPMEGAWAGAQLQALGAAVAVAGIALAASPGWGVPIAWSLLFVAMSMGIRRVPWGCVWVETLWESRMLGDSPGSWALLTVAVGSVWGKNPPLRLRLAGLAASIGVVALFSVPRLGLGFEGGIVWYAALPEYAALLEVSWPVGVMGLVVFTCAGLCAVVHIVRVYYGAKCLGVAVALAWIVVGFGAAGMGADVIGDSLAERVGAHLAWIRRGGYTVLLGLTWYLGLTLLVASSAWPSAAQPPSDRPKRAW